MEWKAEIILIDDHVALTDALKILLEQQKFKVVGVAHTFIDAKEEIKNTKCDLAIIDMNIGPEDSCDLIKLCQLSNIKSLVLSAYSDVHIVRKAVKAGASGYISKSSASNYIISAIDEILSENQYFDPIIQDLINKTFSNLCPNPKSTNERYNPSMLSKREKQIVKLIAAEYSSEEIAKELFLSKNTVDTYRKTIIQKVGVRNSVGLGVWAVENDL